MLKACQASSFSLCIIIHRKKYTTYHALTDGSIMSEWLLGGTSFFSVSLRLYTELQLERSLFRYTNPYFCILFLTRFFFWIKDDNSPFGCCTYPGVCVVLS